jgi:hypothetical protein
VQAVRQVVFTDVLVVGRPIGLHKIDAASDWLLIKRHCIGTSQHDISIYRKEDVLFQLKIRGASEKFKNQPRPLLRPRSANLRQHFLNLSRKTVSKCLTPCQIL